MSYYTYDEFSDQMSDILSSGGCFEMSDFHRTEIQKLIDGMDRDRVIEDLNIFYKNEEPYELREGELEAIAEMINATVETRIVFE